MYYFLPKSNGRVDALLNPKNGKPIEGFLTTETIPAVPDFGEGNAAHLYYLNGELAWKSVPIALIENGVEVNHNASASELRRQAYEAECDPYSMAYVGYMLEGNEAAAATCKTAYLTKKAEIRERIPDEEG